MASQTRPTTTKEGQCRNSMQYGVPRLSDNSMRILQPERPYGASSARPLLCFRPALPDPAAYVRVKIRAADALDCRRRPLMAQPWPSLPAKVER